MGRHSAPDDDADKIAVAVATAVAPAPRRGRHAVPEDDDPDAAPAGATEAAAEQAEPARVARGNQSTAADVALLREHSEVRARVIAALVAPFVLYTVAIYIAGALDAYFLWVWVPLVTAGVGAGSIMDAAHRKHRSG
jgi:hypothetical protein